jgi:ABC-type amino acid transport substrate-binding protein
MILLSSCGWLIDRLTWLQPGASDLHRDPVCTAGMLSVGLAAGPFPPFVFPVVPVDGQSRVTGLDVELLERMVKGLETYCRHPIHVNVRLIPFPKLFRELQEGMIDIFLSGTPADIPAPGTSGFGYSLPYLREGGIGLVVREPAVYETMTNRIALVSKRPLGEVITDQILAGLHVAVQEGTSAEMFMKANLPRSSLLVCRSLDAAFAAAMRGDRQIDVVLGSSVVLKHVSMDQPKERRWSIVQDRQRPYQLTHEQYSVVMADSRYQLRWFVNNLLFYLEEQGELDKLRHRWLVETYDYRERVRTAGIPVSEEAREEQERRGCWTE